MRRRLIWWWKIIKQYLQNCSMHGVRYLVDERLSLIERFLWLIFCVICWIGCANMIMDVVRNYILSPVAVTTETMYLNWETPFPAIAFCITSTKTIKSKYFKRNPGMFTNYSNPGLLRASSEELLSAYEMMRVPCSEFLAECTWNNMKFNCCTEFQELKKTGVGYCVAMNTFHLKKNNKPSVRFFVNRTVKYGDLVIDIPATSKKNRSFFRELTVYIFNNLQLPMFTNTDKDKIHMMPGKTTPIQFIMQDTFNTDGVKSVAVEYRNCRFPYEKLANSMFDIYSSNSCYLEMIIERMIKFCGCVNFYYLIPDGARACNGSEMLCIIANKTEIMSKATGDQRCLMDCEGTSLIINRLELSDYDSPDHSYSRLHFTLLSHPTMRYRRYVVNDLLDFIVAVGSAFGLFTGISILSIFEIPYWLFIRRDRLA